MTLACALTFAVYENVFHFLSLKACSLFHHSKNMGLSAGTGKNCILVTWDLSLFGIVLFRFVFCLVSFVCVICAPVPAAGTKNIAVEVPFKTSLKRIWK